MKKVKKVFVMLFALGLLVGGSRIQAQSPVSEETVILDWTHLAENREHHIEVSGKIVNCGNMPQIMLNVFNENGVEKHIHFTLKASDRNGNEFSTVFDFTIPLAAMQIAQCGDETFNNLKVALPENFDAASAKLTVEF